MSTVFPGSSKKWGLKAKAVALAIALGTLPVLGIGATAYHFANRSITEQVLESRKAKAVALADKVNSFMFDRYGDIQTLASLPVIADPRVNKLIPLQQKQEALDRFLQNSKIYNSIAVADLAGNTVLQSEGEPVTGLGERDYFREVLKTDRPVITNPRKSALTGDWSIFVAAPVKDVITGKTIGVIRSRLPVEYLAEKIKNLETGGEQYDVIDAEGKLFIAHNPADVGKEIQLEYPVFTQLRAGEQAVARVAFSQSDKAEKVLAIAPTQDIEGLPNFNWKVLLDLDTATAFKTQRELLVILLIGTVITAVIVSAIAAYLANRAAKSLNEIVNAVASSSAEIAATVEQQEATANQQAASVNQTTTTMDELGASSVQSTEQAEAALAAARQVLALVDSSVAIARHSGESSLRDKVGQIAQHTLHLSEQVGQIYRITNLVRDLAKQTNMLALNAAVEAVRAGEQGKGFGVVASEIRKLADQSKKSAEKINNVVADIQNATHSTVMVTDEGTIAVENIVAGINNILVNSQQISLNAKQQAVAVQQVVETMNTLNLSARQTAQGLGQTKIGTQKLNSAALDLKAMV